jgi:hypothetical protein
MSKRSKSRQDELIRSMEGLAVLEAQKPEPTKPKPARPKIELVASLITGVIVASAVLWWLLH